MTAPTLNTSAAYEYEPPLQTSGAMYPRVPQLRFVKSALPDWAGERECTRHSGRTVHGCCAAVKPNGRESPKSLTTMSPSRLRSRLPGLMSRWTMRRSCNSAIARTYGYWSQREVASRCGEGDAYQLGSEVLGLGDGQAAVLVDQLGQLAPSVIVLKSSSSARDRHLKRI